MDNLDLGAVWDKLTPKERNEIKKLLFDIKEATDSIFEYLGEKRDFLYIVKTRCYRGPLKESLK